MFEVAMFSADYLWSPEQVEWRKFAMCDSDILAFSFSARRRLRGGAENTGREGRPNRRRGDCTIRASVCRMHGLADRAAAGEADRTLVHTPCSAKAGTFRECRALCRPTTFELLGLAQHCIGSHTLSQKSDCCPTNVPLLEERLVVHRSVDPNQKLVGLAGLALCHENMRRLVPGNFEHLLTYR
jgi:hypothetical protein